MKDVDMSFNKQELVSKIAEESGLTKADANRALDATLDVISNALAAGGEVRLTGFGTFTTSKRKATTGRNPRTGESIKIKASTQAKFRPGKALRDAVN